MIKRVYLEITNTCNLNCPFCTYEKGNNFLSFDLIENYIKQIKPICNYIYLHILGEPLLHPDFNRILNLLDTSDMNLQLVTNGTLLYKYPNIFSHKCIRKLSISVHSINNIDLSSDYFNTINRLIDSNSNTNIELRFYDYDNLNQTLKDYLANLKNKYSFIETSKKNSYKLKDNVYIYFENIFEWPDINHEIVTDIGTCHGGKDMIAINSNSDVTLCCLDPKAYNKIGSLKQDSLENILNSELYRKYINDFKNKKLTAPLCIRCSYHQRFKV